VSLLRLRDSEEDEEEEELECFDALACQVLDLLASLAELGDEQALAATEGLLDVLTSLMTSTTVAEEAARTLSALLNQDGGDRTVRALTADNLSSLALCLDISSAPVEKCAAWVLNAVAECGGERMREMLMPRAMLAMAGRLKSKRDVDPYVRMKLLQALQYLACADEIDTRLRWVDLTAAGAPDIFVAALADAAAGAWDGSSGNSLAGFSSVCALKAILLKCREAKARVKPLSRRSLETLRRLAAGEVEAKGGGQDVFDYRDAAKSILDALE
jgi:hypothetical protein